MNEKQMPALVFKIMTTIMSVMQIFRNIDNEIMYVGTKYGDYVLDFGCGLGFNTIPAAKIVGSKGKIFALDINQKSIEIVTQKAEKYNLKNINTILSDCNTGIENKSIDIVYLHNTFPMIKNKNDVLNEIYKVLKINGKLSYISRFGSQLIGKNMMTDKNLEKYLRTEYNTELIKHKNGHSIFKKIK